MAMYCAALITLFTPFEYLSDATSISTLFSFFLVAACLIWRRYYGQSGAAAGASPWPPAVHIAWLVLSAAGGSFLLVLCFALWLTLVNPYSLASHCAQAGASSWPPAMHIAWLVLSSAGESFSLRCAVLYYYSCDSSQHGPL